MYAYCEEFTQGRKNSKRKVKEKNHPHFCCRDIDIAFEEEASPNESVLITEGIFRQKISGTYFMWIIFRVCILIRTACGVWFKAKA